MKFLEQEISIQPQSADAVIELFATSFPNAPIFGLPPENPSEIIAEIEPVSAHDGWSNVVAAVNEAGSAPHYNDTAEIYRVDIGELHLYTKAGEDAIKKNVLVPGQEHDIQPGIVHWAESAKGWTIFQAISYPQGWTPDSHHPVPKPIK